MKKNRRTVLTICLLIALVILIALALHSCQPRVQIEQAQYRVYLPMAYNHFNTRRGIANSNGHPEDIARLGAVWAYNWSVSPPVYPGGAESVPMISTASAVESPIGGNSRWLMGFNEPNDVNQADLTPDEAAILWHRIEERFPDRFLVAPVPVTHDPFWLVQFYDAYVARYGQPPRLDALAMHCYFTTSKQCKELAQWFMDKAMEWGAGEVWITEFAFRSCAEWDYPKFPNQALAEMDEFIGWVETQPMITRYAWFSNRTNANEWWVGIPFECYASPLINFYTGKITEYGKAY